MSLSDDLSDVFADMKILNNKPDGWEYPEDGELDPNEWPLKLKDGDRFMADGVAKAIKNSVETGSTAGSVYTGTCSLGTSPGTVVGVHIQTDASAGEQDGADALYDATQKMKDAGENASNDDFWQGIVDCCATIIGDTVIKESLSGTVIPPSPPPPTVPAVGSGQGSLDDTAAQSVLLNLLKAIPTAMGSSGDNSILSTLMSTAIITYLTTIIVNMEGQGPLAGLEATNVMVGNQ